MKSMHSGQQAGMSTNPDEHGQILALQEDNWQYPLCKVDEKIKNLPTIVLIAIKIN
jgi:hypothetical protein